MCTPIKARLCAAALSAVWLSAQAVPAQRPGLYGSDADGNLILINESTGAGTPLCVLPQGGTEIIYDNAAQRSFQQLSDGAFQIVEFNINSCANIGTPAGESHSFTGLEYVGVTLYGTGIDSGGGNAPSTLYTLNPVTGAPTVVGPTGVTHPIAGLAYDTAGGIMYCIAGGPSPANLYRINLTTGAATLIGSTGIQAGSLRFGISGTLFAVGTGDTGNGGNLYSINVANGAATLVGSTGLAAVTGLALVLPPPPIPTLSTWPLLALIGAMLLAGVSTRQLLRSR
jgi:hypothetical protein